MYRTRNSGFSLVELLVAMVIGLIGSIIIFQVYAVFEGQKRTTTSGGDTQTNLAIGMNAIEHAGTDAGYGINFDAFLGCDALGWYQKAGPSSPTPPAGEAFVVKLLPVYIRRAIDTDPNSAFQSLTFVRTGNDTSYSVTKIKGGFPLASFDNSLYVDNMYGFTKGDVLVIGEKVSTTQIKCAVTQVRNFSPDPLPANAIPDYIDHTYGNYYKITAPTIELFTHYNKVGGLGTMTAAEISAAETKAGFTINPPVTVPATHFNFTSAAFVMNVGQAKGTALGLKKTVFTLNNGQLTESGSPVVDGIVFMEAQYGIAANSTATAVTYTKTHPTTQADWLNVRTVRVVMIGRVGQYDKSYTSPAQLTVWNTANPTNLPATYDVPTAERNYRYKVVQMVIPLRNMFWRP